MRENWERFIEITKLKSISHTKVAQYWDVVHNVTNIVIITLGATTTFLSLVKSVPSFVISAVAAITTLTSAIMAFMRPHDRRQTQIDSAKVFKVLMLRMVQCETEKVYEQLWLELNKAVMDEPFLPKKFKTGEEDLDWNLTPELQMLIAEKDHELEEVLESRIGTPCQGPRKLIVPPKIIPTTVAPLLSASASRVTSPATTSSPVATRNRYDEVDLFSDADVDSTLDHINNDGKSDNRFNDSDDTDNDVNDITLIADNNGIKDDGNDDDDDDDDYRFKAGVNGAFGGESNRLIELNPKI